MNEPATREPSPIRPGVMERFVSLLPLPYPLAAFAWALIVGPFGFHVALFAETGSLASLNLYNEILGVLELFYLFYTIRYLRISLLSAEPRISPILAGGSESYPAFFRHFGDLLPVIPVAIVIGVPAFLASHGPLGWEPLPIYAVFTSVLVPLTIATFVWEYSVASWGLHKVGRSDLRLTSYLEDRFMGTTAIGTLALALTLAYFAGLVILFFQSSTFLPVYTNPAAQGFFIVLFALGIALFFLPLFSLHGRMQAQRAHELAALGRRFDLIRQRIPGDPSLEVPSAESTLVRLKENEIEASKLASTPTWPFDLQLLGRLIAIIISVVAIILSKVISDLIHV